MGHKNIGGVAEFVKQHFDYNEPLPFEVTKIFIPKNGYVVIEGQEENYLYFLVDGIVEIGMNKNGENYIIEFLMTGQFFTSFIAFISRTPTEVYHLALTNCTIERIHYKDIQKLSPTSLIVNRLMRHTSEQGIMIRIAKEKQLASLSAEEMYLELLKKRPYLLQKISVKRIAKYLNIHPQSLSRIRKVVTQKSTNKSG
jgi:CRP-like cAMP-binding protein